jgi:hypothetical protein
MFMGCEERNILDVITMKRPSRAGVSGNDLLIENIQEYV